MHVQASETDPTTIPPNPNETTTCTSTCISYTSKRSPSYNNTLTFIQNPNIESKKWREIKRSYRGHLGNEEKNYFLSFFPLSVKTLVFPSSSGKTKTKGGAEKSKRRRTVAGKTTSLHRFRRFELDSGVYQVRFSRIMFCFSELCPNR